MNDKKGLEMPVDRIIRESNSEDQSEIRLKEQDRHLKIMSALYNISKAVN